MKTSKILLGVLAAAAAGALIGILFAPDKGDETRKKIGKKAKDLADDLASKMTEFIDEMTEKFESVKKTQESSEKEAESVSQP